MPIAAILMTIGGLYLLSRQKPVNETARMKKYLEVKYDKKFIVENYRVQGVGLAVEGGGVADAYRESGSAKFKFLVLEQGSSYRDNYLSAFYNEQEDKSISEFVKKIGLENTRYITDITISPETADNIRGIPSLSEMLDKHGDAVDYGVYIIKTGNQPNDDDIDKLKSLIGYVKEKNPLKYSVRYVINSETEDSRYVCQYYGASEKERYKDSYIECFKNHEGRE